MLNDGAVAGAFHQQVRARGRRVKRGVNGGLRRPGLDALARIVQMRCGHKHRSHRQVSTVGKQLQRGDADCAAAHHGYLQHRYILKLVRVQGQVLPETTLCSATGGT
ncbi:hypothetical protein D3C71_1244370 [compost metagenome]